MYKFTEKWYLKVKYIQHFSKELCLMSASLLHIFSVLFPPHNQTQIQLHLIVRL